MAYRIEIARAARKQVLALPRQGQIEVARSVDCLAATPRHSGCRKLHGIDLWRVRVGQYRVIYKIEDKNKLVMVVKVAPRREDTYQGLKGVS